MNFFCSFFTYSQELSAKSTINNHDFYIGLGYMAYNNSQTIPNGMEGKVWNLRYNYSRTNTILKRSFIYSARFDNCGLKNSYVYNGDVVLIKYLKFSTSGDWLRTIYIKKSLLILAGIGFGFSGEATYPTSQSEDLIGAASIFGNWSVSTSLTNKISYRFKSVYLENIFTIPILTTGYFMEYQYNPTVVDNIDYSYYLTPNTFTSIRNYLVVDNQIKASFPFNKICISLSYFLTYCNYDINSNKQLYIQHMAGLGVNF